MTVSAYLGHDSIEPFLAACRRHGSGIFLLVRTSNAGAADIQDLTLSDGRPLWQYLASLVHEWGQPLVGERGISSVGAVVGATMPRAVSEARKLMPQTPILLPGVGAQGATPADVARAFTTGPATALVTVSRTVIFAFRETDEDWRVAAAQRSPALAGPGHGRSVRLVRSGCRVSAPVMLRALLAGVVVALAALVLPVHASSGLGDAPRIDAAAWYLVGDDGRVLAQRERRGARARSRASRS